MNNIIKWDANRFVIKEYTDTNAVYIYDTVSNIGYTNQTETANLCEVSQQAISKTTKKLPKDLKALRDKDFTIQPISLENPNGGIPYLLYNHRDFGDLLFYYVQFASGKEKRSEAAKLLFKIKDAGSLAYIMHKAGVKTQAVLDEPIIIENVNAHDWLTARLKGKVQRRSFTDALMKSWQIENYHWSYVEQLNVEGFFAKWTNYTYILLFGTNAQGLRNVKHCPKNQSWLIGRNHITSHDFLNAVAKVESYVGKNYHSEHYNNFKKLICEGSTIAILEFGLPKSKTFVETFPQIQLMESKKVNALPEGVEE